MIYTIGRRDVYERALSEQPEVFKREGGSVWQTEEAAREYLELNEDDKDDAR